MRPTDDERREVAKRMRDMAPGSDWPNYVAEACGMDVSKMSNNFHTFTEQLCQRIADLIEPEERTCTVEHWGGGTFYLSCGHAAPGYPGSVLFCPNCGAKVVCDA